MALPELNFTVYLIILLVLLGSYGAFSFYFIRKYFSSNKGMESKNYLPLIYGLSIVFFLLGRLFLAIFDMLTEFESTNYNAENVVFWKIGTMLQVIGYGFFFVQMEKRIMKGKDKYILVIAFFALTIIAMILPDFIMATNFTAIAFVISAYIPCAYLYISIKSEGIVRKKSTLVFLGFILSMLGALITAETIIEPLSQATGLLRIDFHSIAFPVSVLGLIFLFYGFK